MNLPDLEHLRGLQRELLQIADSLETIRERNRGRRLSRLLRVVAEMHDHQAKLMDIIELNSPRLEAEGSSSREKLVGSHSPGASAE
jgi:hypothetical protein